ncbi:MAG: hydrolase [Thiohalomonadaceae bacterium]
MSQDNPLLLSADQSLLILVDVQVRLAAAMPDADRARVLRQGAALLRGADLLQVPVIVSEQYPKGLGHTEPALAETFPAAAAVVEKTCFACSGETRFREALAGHGRRQVVVAGMEAHVCVLQTALELHAAGHEVFVVEDAVSSRDPANRDNAMARLRQAGVTVTNTESVLFEWLRDASHTQFKAVSALIK